MAPRSRLLDLERHDVLFFYDGDGAYHQFQSDDRVSVATYGIVFWPVFLVAALLLHLVVPFAHAAAVCGALYVAYCFLLDRAAQASRSSSSWRRAAGGALSPHGTGGRLYDRAEVAMIKSMLVSCFS